MPNPFDAVPPITELGVTGLKRQNGWVYEEAEYQLRGRLGRETYRRMADADPIIGAILFAIEQSIRKANWTVEPYSDKPRDAKLADFLWSCMNDLNQSWTEVIASIIHGMLVFGFSYHEIVYKKREGPDGETSSKFNDGLFGWRKIPVRAQETIEQWEFDDNDGIQGAWQGPRMGRDSRFIPINRALLFRTTSHKGNPEGRSVLRNAWWPTYSKRRLEELEGVGAERDIVGLPRFRVPSALLSPSASAAEKAALAGYEEIVINVRNDEQGGLIIPSDRDPITKEYIYDFDLVKTPGEKMFNLNEIITRKSTEIAQTVLFDIIMLGHTNTGSYNLGATKEELFTASLDAWLDIVAAVFNQYAVPRLLRANGMPLDRYPQIVHGETRSVDLNKLGTFLQQAGGAKVLTWDLELENAVRAMAGLPLGTGESRPVDQGDPTGDPGASKTPPDKNPNNPAATAKQPAQRPPKQGT